MDQSKLIREKGDKVCHLVVDSAAFIKHSEIHEIAENVYSVQQVVNEIKDSATLQRLQVLPYELHLQEPSHESLKTVTDFSKKAGDFSCLSATDLRVIALTYELHKQHIGVENIRTEPKINVRSENGSVANDLISNSLPGFFFPSSKTQTEDSASTEIKDRLGSEEEGNCSSNSDDDDDASWIAPENVEEARESIGNLSISERPVVACMTTDFAMQNTLLQMGLGVISVDGMLIKATRTYIRRCHGCFKTTKNMVTSFCPHCGNTTLKRVAVVIDQDGTMHLNLAFRRPINTRGTRYSLPMPKGGKHAVNPELCADQRFPQNRPSSMARKKTEALDPDYVAGISPFAQNDVYSRAANLGIRNSRNGYPKRRNPNEVIKRKK